MANYYVNNEAQPEGDHEVHREDCHRMPTDRKYLGDYSNCAPAVAEAKRTYPSADGCWHCSPECHSS